MSSNRDQIHIYVDISNIFHDYHGRIDVNGLVDVVSNNNQREVMRKVAVGSISAHSTTKSEQERPWIEQNFEITFLSRIRGENGECEQSVDDLIHAAIQEDLLRTFSSCRTMILLTGDGNSNNGRTSFPKVVEQALIRGWNVELWCHQKSLSNVFARMQDFYLPQFIIRLLDSHLHRILSNPNAGKRKGLNRDDVNVIPDSNALTGKVTNVMNRKAPGKETKKERKIRNRENSKQQKAKDLAKKQKSTTNIRNQKRQSVSKKNEVPKRPCGEVLDLCSSDDDDDDDNNDDDNNELVQVNGRIELIEDSDSDDSEDDGNNCDYFIDRNSGDINQGRNTVRNEVNDINMNDTGRDGNNTLRETATSTSSPSSALNMDQRGKIDCDDDRSHANSRSSSVHSGIVSNERTDCNSNLSNSSNDGSNLSTTSNIKVSSNNSRNNKVVTGSSSSSTSSSSSQQYSWQYDDDDEYLPLPLPLSLHFSVTATSKDNNIDTKDNNIDTKDNNIDTRDNNINTSDGKESGLLKGSSTGNDSDDQDCIIVDNSSNTTINVNDNTGEDAIQRKLQQKSMINADRKNSGYSHVNNTNNKLQIMANNTNKKLQIMANNTNNKQQSIENTDKKNSGYSHASNTNNKKSNDFNNIINDKNDTENHSLKSRNGQRNHRSEELMQLLIQQKSTMNSIKLKNNIRMSTRNDVDNTDHNEINRNTCNSISDHVNATSSTSSSIRNVRERSHSNDIYYNSSKVQKNPMPSDVIDLTDDISPVHSQNDDTSSSSSSSKSSKSKISSHPQDENLDLEHSNSEYRNVTIEPGNFGDRYIDDHNSDIRIDTNYSADNDRKLRKKTSQQNKGQGNQGSSSQKRRREEVQEREEEMGDEVPQYWGPSTDTPYTDDRGLPPSEAILRGQEHSYRSLHGHQRSKDCDR